MKKIALILEIPTPYRNPVFKRLLEMSEFHFDIYFLSTKQHDRAWQLNLDFPCTDLKSKQHKTSQNHTLYYSLCLSQIILSKKYDGYIVFGYAQPLFYQIYKHCWKHNLPYATATESHLIKKRSTWIQKLKHAYVKKVYTNTKANLVTSSLAKDYVMHYGAKSETCFLFPNTIDGPEFSKHVQSFRKNKNNEKKILLFVGSLNERKGIDVLWETFKTLSVKHPHLHLLLVGSGPYHHVIEKDFIRQKYSVELPGFVSPENLPKFYAQADLFILPSRDEPFGAVICEAAAAGLPIITTQAVGASVDFVKENGVVLGSLNTRALAQAIESLIFDPKKLNGMGQKSLEIMNTWTHDFMAHQIIQCARSLF